MGPPISDDPSLTASTIVLTRGSGSNLFDVDGNRYVDLAAGFGALLLGHSHPAVTQALEAQAPRLLQALGDVYPADAKIALMERLSRLYPEPDAQVILGQSGADALTAALKTAVLHTQKPGILAFSGAYHGLSYAPLSASSLRSGYRTPFAEQLNPHVTFIDYPNDEASLEPVLERVRFELSSGRFGAVLVEPILGRGGVIIPPRSFLPELCRRAFRNGAVVIADEIWTGLGRAGRWLYSVTDECTPDIVCLGKGLGGGLPISAVIGRRSIMQSWRQNVEVVHTSTFAGAPLACVTALATLDTLTQRRLVERSRETGVRWLKALGGVLEGSAEVQTIRGAGLMIGIDLGPRPGSAVRLQTALLNRGYIVSTGGGSREVLVLTPALTAHEPLLFGFVAELLYCLHAHKP